MRNYLKSFANSESLFQVIKVGLVGVLNTVVSLALFTGLLWLLGSEADRGDGFEAPVVAATTIAFALTTLMSYMLNRRWTFQLGQNTGGTGETAKFFAINGVALVVTNLIVSGANSLWGPLSNRQLTVAYVGAAVLIILPKFAGYRDVVFRHALRAEENETEPATSAIRDT